MLQGQRGLLQGKVPELSAGANFIDRSTDIADEGHDPALCIGEPPARLELIGRAITRMVGRLCASPAYLEKSSRSTSNQAVNRHCHLVSVSRDRSRARALHTDAGAVHT